MSNAVFPTHRHRHRHTHTHRHTHRHTQRETHTQTHTHNVTHTASSESRSFTSDTCLMKGSNGFVPIIIVTIMLKFQKFNIIITIITTAANPLPRPRSGSYSSCKKKEEKKLLQQRLRTLCLDRGPVHTALVENARRTVGLLEVWHTHISNTLATH